LTIGCVDDVVQNVGVCRRRVEDTIARFLHYTEVSVAESGSKTSRVDLAQSQLASNCSQVRGYVHY